MKIVALVPCIVLLSLKCTAVVPLKDIVKKKLINTLDAQIYVIRNIQTVTGMQYCVNLLMKMVAGKDFFAIRITMRQVAATILVLAQTIKKHVLLVKVGVIVQTTTTAVKK